MAPVPDQTLYDTVYQQRYMGLPQQNPEAYREGTPQGPVVSYGVFIYDADNKRLYRKLLLDFGANYGRVAGEIREALDAKDFGLVHSLVHNLKGLAGNLEAKDLQAATVEMEKLVKGQSQETVSENEIEEKIAELERALDQALEAVHTLGRPAEKKIIESSAAVGPSA